MKSTFKKTRRKRNKKKEVNCSHPKRYVNGETIGNRYSENCLLCESQNINVKYFKGDK